MRVTMEKVQQFVGLKFGEDIANELQNRVKVVLPPPKHSTVAIARHVEYEQLIRTQQTTLLTAMRAQLKALEDAVAAAGSGGVSSVSSVDDEALLKIARLKNEIAEIEFESKQEVPHKLTSEESPLYGNEMKTHSLRVATLEKHRGQFMHSSLVSVHSSCSTR